MGVRCMCARVKERSSGSLLWVGSDVQYFPVLSTNREDMQEPASARWHGIANRPKRCWRRRGVIAAQAIAGSSVRSRTTAAACPIERKETERERESAMGDAAAPKRGVYFFLFCREKKKKKYPFFPRNLCRACSASGTNTPGLSPCALSLSLSLSYQSGVSYPSAPQFARRCCSTQFLIFDISSRDPVISVRIFFRSACLRPSLSLSTKFFFDLLLCPPRLAEVVPRSSVVTYSTHTQQRGTSCDASALADIQTPMSRASNVKLHVRVCSGIAALSALV